MATMATVGTTSAHFVFDIQTVMQLARQEDLSLPETAEAGHMAALIDAERHLLNLLFTIPEQLDRKRAATLHGGTSISQQLASFGRLARHQGMAVLIDHIDQC